MSHVSHVSHDTSKIPGVTNTTTLGHGWAAKTDCVSGESGEWNRWVMCDNHFIHGFQSCRNMHSYYLCLIRIHKRTVILVDFLGILHLESSHVRICSTKWIHFSARFVFASLEVHIFGSEKCWGFPGLGSVTLGMRPSQFCSSFWVGGDGYDMMWFDGMWRNVMIWHAVIFDK